jgi:deoxyribonuclease V
LQALGQLRATPHAIICDGQGLAHPRRLGLATHLGLCLDVPTIGSAKSRLCGEATDILERRRGSRVPLVDNGEQVGEVVRTRDGVKPLWVSPGNRIDFATATGIVLANATRFRLPEPQRRADRLAAETKRAAAKES